MLTCLLACLLTAVGLQTTAVSVNFLCAQPEVLYKHHLLESETYIGGKVEAIESGVFRSDLPTRFKCKAAAYQGLIDCLDRDLSYAIKHDGGWELSDVANYEEVKAEIMQMLEALRDAPNRCACTSVTHTNSQDGKQQALLDSRSSTVLLADAATHHADKLLTLRFLLCCCCCINTHTHTGRRCR